MNILKPVYLDEFYRWYLGREYISSTFWSAKWPWSQILVSNPSSDSKQEMGNVKYPSWLNRKSKIRITWIFFWAWNGMNFGYLNNTTFKIFKNYLSRISRILEFVKSKQRNMPRRQVRRWMRFMFSLFVNKARMMIFTIDLNLDRFFWRNLWYHWQTTRCLWVVSGHVKPRWLKDLSHIKIWFLVKG